MPHTPQLGLHVPDEGGFQFLFCVSKLLLLSVCVSWSTPPQSLPAVSLGHLGSGGRLWKRRVQRSYLAFVSSWNKCHTQGWASWICWLLLIFTAMMWGRDHLHFMRKAQRGAVDCPESHSWQGIELEFPMRTGYPWSPWIFHHTAVPFSYHLPGFQSLHLLNDDEWTWVRSQSSVLVLIWMPLGRCVLQFVAICAFPCPITCAL